MEGPIAYRLGQAVALVFRDAPGYDSWNKTPLAERMKLGGKIAGKVNWVKSFGGSSLEFNGQDTYVDCGTVDTYFSTTSERAEKVMELFAEELRTFKAEGLRKGEIERAKRIIKGAILRTVGQPRDDMKAMVFAYMETGRVRTVDEVIERVESVTPEQVSRFADEFLRRDRMCVAVHASLESARPVAEMALSIDF
jgi:predicted Zn-dependent peptidase